MMDQKEFELRRLSQKKSLKLVDGKPVVKVIDLVESLLQIEDPGLPVVVQVGTWRFPVAFVCADDENNVQIGI